MLNRRFKLTDIWYFVNLTRPAPRAATFVSQSCPFFTNISALSLFAFVPMLHAILHSFAFYVSICHQSCPTVRCHSCVQLVWYVAVALALVAIALTATLHWGDDKKILRLSRSSAWPQYLCHGSCILIGVCYTEYLCILEALRHSAVPSAPPVLRVKLERQLSQASAYQIHGSLHDLQATLVEGLPTPHLHPHPRLGRGQVPLRGRTCPSQSWCSTQYQWPQLLSFSL